LKVLIAYNGSAGSQMMLSNLASAGITADGDRLLRYGQPTK